MIIWFIVLIARGIHGLPDGAPESTCSKLLPVHGESTAQTSKAPYEIHAVLTGTRNFVHISSPVGETFKGFILQARSSKDPSKFIDGEFTVSQLSKTINCFDSNQNTLTHVNRSVKTEITTEWTPKKHSNEEVIFRATIVKQYEVFWIEVDSNPLKLASTSELAKMELPYDKCFEEEGCVGLGISDGCVERQDCEILLRYSKSNDGVHFILQGFLDKFATDYMAVAWSEDAIMGEDRVRECIRDGTNVIARDSWNEGKSNTRTEDVSRDFYTGSFVDGLTTCSWTSSTIDVNGQTYDFANKKFHILLATGEVSEWRLKYHDKRIASPELLNLTVVNARRDVFDPKEENSSHDIGVKEPPSTTLGEIGSTSQTEESANHMNQTDTPTSSSSYLRSTCLMVIVTGVLFAAKESVNYCIFKSLF